MSLFSFLLPVAIVTTSLFSSLLFFKAEASCKRCAQIENERLNEQTTKQGNTQEDLAGHSEKKVVSEKETSTIDSNKGNLI